MYEIAICDDDEKQCQYIENTIIQYSKRINEKLNISILYSGEDLYKQLKNGEYFDLVFLDISMQFIDGIDIGNKIREEFKNDYTNIVFMSSFTQYALHLFEIRPMNFLPKPLKQEKIFQEVVKGIKLTNTNQNYFIYKAYSKNKKIPLADIIYFEINHRKIKIYHKDGEDMFNGSLSEIHHKLSDYNFIYSHNSYLVNFNHIDNYNNSELIMSNGNAVPFSNKYRKEFKRNLNNEVFDRKYKNN